MLLLLNIKYNTILLYPIINNDKYITLTGRNPRIAIGLEDPGKTSFFPISFLR